MEGGLVDWLFPDDGEFWVCFVDDAADGLGVGGGGLNAEATGGGRVANEDDGVSGGAEVGGGVFGGCGLSGEDSGRRLGIGEEAGGFEDTRPATRLVAGDAVVGCGGLEGRAGQEKEETSG